MKLIKRLIAAAAVLLILLVVFIVIAISSVNSIAKVAIEKGGTYALGVDTKLKSASVGLLSGRFGLSGLEVANPSGFKDPHFLTLGDGGVAVTLASLRSDLIEVPTFSLNAIDVRLERQGDKANYNVILDNLKKLSGDSKGGGSQPSSGGSEKKLIIRDLSIKDVKVSLNLAGMGGAAGAVLGEATKISIPIDEIKLKNVGQTGSGVGGSGVTISELAGIIVRAVLGAAVERGGGLIPADVLGDLQGQLANLGDMKELGMSVVGNVQGTVENLGKQAEELSKKAEDIGKQGKDAVDGVKKGIDDLLGGKKEKKN